MEKSCELCRKPARMFCESDEARLCWDCDEKVHGANFLVAKHSRCLLCHVCQSPTPWKASGTKLSHTVSVCEGCFDNGNYHRSNPITMTTRRPPEEDGDFDRGSSAGSSDDDDNDDDDDEEEGFSDEEDRQIGEEEDGENQVVPWTSCPSGQSPSVSSAPPVTTSSSSSEERGYFSTRNDVLKRSRDHHNQEDSDDEDDACCFSQVKSHLAALENTELIFRASKMARIEEDHPGGQRRRMQLMGSLINFQESTAAGNRRA